MPDFDIDFCQDRRELVIDYVKHQVRHRQRVADARRFGDDGRGRPRWRTSGRVLDLPYGFGRRHRQS